MILSVDLIDQHATGVYALRFKHNGTLVYNVYGCWRGAGEVVVKFPHRRTRVPVGPRLVVPTHCRLGPARHRRRLHPGRSLGAE